MGDRNLREQRSGEREKGKSAKHSTILSQQSGDFLEQARHVQQKPMLVFGDVRVFRHSRLAGIAGTGTFWLQPISVHGYSGTVNLPPIMNRAGFADMC
jgi:hypothetical protein